MSEKTIRGSSTSNSPTIWWRNTKYKHSTLKKGTVTWWGRGVYFTNLFCLFFKCFFFFGEFQSMQCTKNNLVNSMYLLLSFNNHGLMANSCFISTPYFPFSPNQSLDLFVPVVFLVHFVLASSL